MVSFIKKYKAFGIAAILVTLIVFYLKRIGLVRIPKDAPLETTIIFGFWWLVASFALHHINYLKKKKLVEAPFYINLLLGNIACAQPDLLHAGVMLNDLPDQCYWSLAGIGNAQLPMNTLAIAMGGGVRVGLEDNIYYDKNRNIKPRNIELLRRVHRIAAEHDRAAMYPDEFRKKLRMLPGDGEYGRG